MKENKIVIDLENEEAIVLLDWLIRFNENHSNKFEDQAEQRVLFDLESILEKSVSEILSGDYKAILKDARDKLRDEN